MSHAEFEQLTAGYVLGALEPDDEHAFTDHLTGCHVCRAGVRELEQVVGELPRPAVTARRARAHHAAAADRYRRRRRNALVVGPRLKRAVLARIALGLGLLALFGLSFWNMSLRNQAAAGRQLDVYESAARMLNDPDRVDHPADRACRGCEGTVLASTARGQGVLVVEGLPEPVPGRVYQVWTVPDVSKPEQAVPEARLDLVRPAGPHPVRRVRDRRLHRVLGHFGATRREFDADVPGAVLGHCFPDRVDVTGQFCQGRKVTALDNRR